MRTKLAPAVLLLFSLAPLYAAGPEKKCPALKRSDDPGKWTWMDRDCHIRTRAELVDRILANHKLWLKKYAAYLGDEDALEEYGALRDPLLADLSRADLRGANLREANLTRAYLGAADLSGAILQHADLTDAQLDGADLTGANLWNADLTGAYLAGADLTGAVPYRADLTGAHLMGADLTGADLAGADLTDASFYRADLTGAYLGGADLTGARLEEADLTGARLEGADLSSSILANTDFSDVDLTLAKVWYADFEPEVPPPANSIARTDGLETLRWRGSFDEMDYRRDPTMTRDKKRRYVPRPLPSVPERWLVWLSRYREIRIGQSHGWRNDLRFLWSDAFHGLRPDRSDAGSSNKGNSSAKAGGGEPPSSSPSKEPERTPTAAQNQYALIDLRNALKKAGYTEAELQANLAYQRRTQSTLGMIIFDWTCAYGAAPGRPLVIALVLALLAVPIYWLGFRHQLFGGHLLLVEKQDGKDVETPLADLRRRPGWSGPVRGDDRSLRAIMNEITERRRSKSHSAQIRPLRFVASCWPRVRWEAAFLKSVVLFSLMSVVNLGFQGLDFGRWVRNLFFREYDLKARGWLRAVSGLQSLVGLGLLALSLLSFFGHAFE
jgi:uncharacterized protein YjbI with pentapeptide repeats